jgi:aryl-alcohol dehydrogenase-like predicted oxidoreductase
VTFGDEGWEFPKDEARKIYETYREAGGNLIGTANLYTNGTSGPGLRISLQGPVSVAEEYYLRSWIPQACETQKVMILPM